MRRLSVIQMLIFMVMIKIIGKGDLVYEGTISTTDSIVHNLLGRDDVNIKDIHDHFNSVNWDDALKEDNRLLITDVQEGIGNVFSNLFGIFNFVSQVKQSVILVYDIVTNVDEAPKFNINVKDSKYITDGIYTIVDMSWYSPYKEFGDNVICMFFYLCFVWYAFTHLPSIIKGAGSAYTVYTDNKPIDYELTGKE